MHGTFLWRDMECNDKEKMGDFYKLSTKNNFFKQNKISHELIKSAIKFL